MRIVDRGVAAFFHMNNIPLRACRKVEGRRIEFEFDISDEAGQQKKIDYYNSQLCKFDQAKIGLMKLAEQMIVRTEQQQVRPGPGTAAHPSP